MKKTSVVIILSAGVLTAICFWALVTKADDSALMPNDNQALHDEGYGNADAEYYNSEDDRVNDQDASTNNETIPPDAIGSIGNDAQ